MPGQIDMYLWRNYFDFLWLCCESGPQWTMGPFHSLRAVAGTRAPSCASFEVTVQVSNYCERVRPASKSKLHATNSNLTCYRSFRLPPPKPRPGCEMDSGFTEARSHNIWSEKTVENFQIPLSDLWIFFRRFKDGWIIFSVADIAEITSWKWLKAHFQWKRR